MAIARLKLFFCSPKIFYYCTLWLCVLLLVGTIAQSSIGLYLAQEKYFSSWLIWFGVLPLPGGRLAMTLMFINLLCKLCFASPLKIKQTGTLISHYGVLCLLLGGFLTAYFSKEGGMIIPEKGSSNFFEDYHELELALINTSNKDYDDVIAFSDKYLEPNTVIKDSAFTGSITLLKFFKNSEVVSREPSSDPGVSVSSLKGAAKRFILRELPFNSQDEQNRAGAMFKVDGSGEQSDGVYLIYEYMPVSQTILLGKQSFVVTLRHKRHLLPFSIELLDFSQVFYPGTQKAKSYQSIVQVLDDGAKRKVDIVMNEPLRHKGYTFYQASFIEEDTRDTTILAVVKNAGRLFPYVSSIVICIGLLVHLLIQLPHLIRKHEEA